MLVRLLRWRNILMFFCSTTSCTLLFTRLRFFRSANPVFGWNVGTNLPDFSFIVCKWMLFCVLVRFRSIWLVAWLLLHKNCASKPNWQFQRINSKLLSEWTNKKQFCYNKFYLFFNFFRFDFIFQKHLFQYRQQQHGKKLIFLS